MLLKYFQITLVLQTIMNGWEIDWIDEFVELEKSRKQSEQPVKWQQNHCSTDPSRALPLPSR